MYFELVGTSSYWGFELPGVKLLWSMKEIQGKSTLIRVSARFKVAKVRVIGSQLSVSSVPDDRWVLGQWRKKEGFLNWQLK